MFDLLQHCKLLQNHISEDKIGFGINHKMQDFKNNREKNLDLVICRPSENGYAKGNFGDLRESYGIKLDDKELKIFSKLPLLRKSHVGMTLVALEAKACMTEHLKARPRLYDELTSSYQTIQGDTADAIAVGLVMINLGSSFISPGKNKREKSLDSPEINQHKQPHAALSVFNKIKELARRTNVTSSGFDALGVILVNCANDGSDISTSSHFEDSLVIDPNFTYSKMIERMSHIYSTRFANL